MSKPTEALQPTLGAGMTASMTASMTATMTVTAVVGVIGAGTMGAGIAQVAAARATR